MLYDTILKLVGMGIHGLQDQQRTWLADRAACGADRACIRNTEARIRTLETETARARRPIDRCLAPWRALPVVRRSSSDITASETSKLA